MRKLFKAVLLSSAFVVTSEALALSLEDSTHLLRRVSFGVSAHPDFDASQLNRVQAVERLLESAVTTIDVPPPAWLAYTPKKIDKSLPLSKEALREFQRVTGKLRRTHRKEIKSWWLQQIYSGRSPVAERFILFWQNYFATEIDLLPSPAMVWHQQLSLRKYAFGNYRHMLRAMNRDPALLWYLDNHINNKKKPNENYARELLELYTLGEGSYSEKILNSSRGL